MWLWLQLVAPAADLLLCWSPLAVQSARPLPEGGSGGARPRPARLLRTKG